MLFKIGGGQEAQAWVGRGQLRMLTQSEHRAGEMLWAWEAQARLRNAGCALAGGALRASVAGGPQTWGTGPLTARCCCQSRCRWDLWG